MKHRPGLSFDNMEKFSYLSIIAYNPAILTGPALPDTPLNDYFLLKIAN